MALPTFPDDAVEFLEEVNGNTYNSGTNPYGLAKGGHRQNWSPAMNYMADATTYVRDAATEVEGLAEQVAEDAASAAAGSGTEATVANIRAGAAAEYVSIRRILAAMEPVGIAFATPLAWTVTSGIVFTVTLTANTTLPNPTAGVAGKSGFIDIVQGGAGGFQITSFGSQYKFFGSGIDWPTAPGAITKLSYYFKTATECHLAFAGNAS